MTHPNGEGPGGAAPHIEHDQQNGEFSANVAGGKAVLSYSAVGDDVLDFRSTFVPPADRKQGVGERIVLHALRYARDQGARVRPTCWFVAKVIERNPEFEPLVAP